MNDAALFTDEPAPEASLFTDEPAPEGKSLAGFGKNLEQEVEGGVKGFSDLAENFAEKPGETAVNAIKAIPGGLVKEGQRIGAGELLTGHPIAAAEKFGNAAYEKPISTLFDVAPVLPAAGEALGIGGDAAKAAEVGSEAGKGAEAIPSWSDQTAKTPALNTQAKPLSSLSEGERLDFIDQLKREGKPIPKELSGQAAPEAVETTATASAPERGPLPGADTPPPETPGVKTPPSPLDTVRDYVTQKFGKAAAKPGFPERVSTYLGEEANKLGAKDLGLQPMQMKSLGTGYEGLKRANDLVDYASDKGYLEPALSDAGRRAKILADNKSSGQYVGSLRDIADTRAKPDVQAFKKSVSDALEQKYGAGVEKSPAEIKKVMEEFDRHPATHAGMAEMATDLNKSITNIQKLGQHPGPATDAANLISRLNNDSIRSVLNPKEAELYTKSLRDFGATKKLEQVTAGAGRRAMANRANQRGIFGRLYQEALDRGGYRIGGNVARGMSRAIKARPSIATSLPQFFEELAHQTESTADDLVSNLGMSAGGRVPKDVANYVSCR